MMVYEHGEQNEDDELEPVEQTDNADSNQPRSRKDSKEKNTPAADFFNTFLPSLQQNAAAAKDQSATTTTDAGKTIVSQQKATPFTPNAKTSIKKSQHKSEKITYE